MASNRKQGLSGASAISRFGELFKDCLIEAGELKWGTQLGKGAFAVVHKCMWSRKKPQQEEEDVKRGEEGVEVAVKELKEEVLQSDEHDVKSFFGETQLLQKIKHPHVVSFIGVVRRKYNGSWRIGVVQEYMNMGTLNSLLVKQSKDRRQQMYTERDGLKWMLQIAKSLEYLHSLKPGEVSLIHRDLKPHNILLHKDPVHGHVVAKLADFGLSALVRKRKPRPLPLRRSISKDMMNSWSNEGSLRSWGIQSSSNGKKTGYVNSNLVTRFSLVSDLLRSNSGPISHMDLNKNGQMDHEADVLHNLSERTGSLMYMPPEVVKGDKYNESADVFSFAMVLFEVLWKVKNIYRCTTPGGNAMQEVQCWATAVSEGYRPKVNKYWPDSVKNLIKECWEEAPLRRPSMANVVTRMESILRSGAFKAPEPLPEKEIPMGRVRRCFCF